LSNYPEYKTFYAINANDGSEAVELPILWTNGSGEVGEPPVVGGDGTVYLKVRSYYSDFDINSYYLFGTPAMLDLDKGTTTLINGSPNPYGTGLFFICDEAGASVMGGDRLYYLNHGDSIGGILDPAGTARAGRIIVGRDYAHKVSYESNPDRRNYVPFGQGNLPQVRLIGGAGGGESINGLGMSIGDNKLFYVSQGMLGMYKQNGGGMNYLHNNWTNPSYGGVTVPSQTALEPYITTPAPLPLPQNVPSELVIRLEAEVNDLIRDVLTSGWSNNTHYQPFLFPNGKGHAGIHFTDPSEEAYVLGMAYPFVSSSLQEDIKRYVNIVFSNVNPLTESFSYRSLTGKRRERYYINNDVGREIMANYPFIYTYDTRIYNLWAYAHYTGDWSWIEANWSSIQGQIPTSGSSNSAVANMIGGYRMAVHMRNPGGRLGVATSGLRSRLEWESSNYPPTTWMEENNSSAFVNTRWARGGDIARYDGMTYEVGRALRDYAATPMNVQDKFLRSSLPAQVVTAGWAPGKVEVFSNLPHQQKDAWTQKAFIMQLPYSDLKAYISSSWCKGDLYYIERLVWTARAGGQVAPPKNLRIVPQP
jgi:hypothetical protein